MAAIRRPSAPAVLVLAVLWPSHARALTCTQIANLAKGDVPTAVILKIMDGTGEKYSPDEVECLAREDVPPVVLEAARQHPEPVRTKVADITGCRVPSSWGGNEGNAAACLAAGAQAEKEGRLPEAAELYFLACQTYHTEPESLDVWATSSAEGCKRLQPMFQLVVPESTGEMALTPGWVSTGRTPPNWSERGGTCWFTGEVRWSGRAGVADPSTITSLPRMAGVVEITTPSGQRSPDLLYLTGAPLKMQSTPRVGQSIRLDGVYYDCMGGDAVVTPGDVLAKHLPPRTCDDPWSDDWTRGPGDPGGRARGCMHSYEKGSEDQWSEDYQKAVSLLQIACFGSDIHESADECHALAAWYDPTVWYGETNNGFETWCHRLAATEPALTTKARERACYLGSMSDCSPVERERVSAAAASWSYEAVAAQLKGDAGVRKCLTQTTPLPSTPLEVGFQLTANGHATDVGLYASSKYPALDSCLRAVIPTIKFPDGQPRGMGAKLW